MRMLLIPLVAALAAPTLAAHQWDIQGGGGGTTEVMTVELTVAGYTQVIWQDSSIDFASDVYDAGTGDYIRHKDDGLTGQYVTLGSDPRDGMDKASGDAWTDHYYESRDGAWLWLDTNTDVTMTVVSGGNLTNGSHEIPTWFTLAGSGDWFTGFLLGNAWQNDGNIPGDGAGSYAADVDGGSPDGVMELGGTPFWPVQYSFPMAGAITTWTLSLPGHSKGNLKFLGRIKREGMNDPAGTYTSTLTVTFSL